MTTNASPISGIDITAYLVKDANRAIAFYRDTLGMTPSSVTEGKGAEFTFGDATFGIWQMDDDSWSAGSGVMFAVSDLKAAVDLYKSRGVKFQGDGHIEDMPHCAMAFGEDSEGNHFILHQHKT
ncbi:MAG: VOC family protein [Candidatus Eremiobacteraeota bacterium]|nr:VOC family protein [Candidatus Eremiobacteraeota bacterium]